MKTWIQWAAGFAASLALAAAAQAQVDKPVRLLVGFPPGGSAEPHVHKGFESATYLLQGRVDTPYGEGLK